MRYAKLAYVALNVSDVSRSAAFYGPEIVGLEETPGEGDERFFRCSPDHHNLILAKGRRPGLKRIGWQLESDEDLDRMRAALSDAGLTIHELPEDECRRLHQGATFRVSETYTGATYEYFSNMGELSGVGFRPTVANIDRLGHVILKTPRFKEATEFHEKILNFRCSDIIEDRVRFYRCFPNPYHHSFGLQNDSGIGLAHVNFAVSDIDDIGRAIGRFNKMQVQVIWGPGRHPASDSVFLYFYDPDGLTAEYSFGMEEFPENGARKPRHMLAVKENIDYWDSPRSAPISTGEIEALFG